MQVQYSSASRSSSREKVTLDGSGQGVCRSGVTLDSVLTPDLVGVQGSREDGRGELTSWARFVFSLFSSSLSSCRLRGLLTATEPSCASPTNGGVDGLLNGVDVKQVFGLEWGRSALTGVGFILLDGLDAAGEMGDDPTGGKSSRLLKLSCPTDGGEICSLNLLFPPPPPLPGLLPPLSHRDMSSL